GARVALCTGIRDDRRNFRGGGSSGLFRGISSLKLKRPSGREDASPNHVTSPLYQSTQVAGRPVSRRSAFVESVVALIVVSLALVVLICLAAIAPAMWAFATAAAAGSYTPVGLSRCVSTKDDPSRLACYDELARRPA